MKKRRLNKRGKKLVSFIVILISVLIYVLMAKLGAKAIESIIYQVGLFCGWFWLLMGQFGVLYIIWECEVEF